MITTNKFTEKLSKTASELRLKDKTEKSAVLIIQFEVNEEETNCIMK